MHTFGSLQRQAELFEFEASQGYTVKPSLKTKNKHQFLLTQPKSRAFITVMQRHIFFPSYMYECLAYMYSSAYLVLLETGRGH